MCTTSRCDNSIVLFDIKMKIQYENLFNVYHSYITTFVNFTMDRIFHHRGLQTIFPELVQMLIVEQAWTEINNVLEIITFRARAKPTM